MRMITKFKLNLALVLVLTIFLASCNKDVGFNLPSENNSYDGKEIYNNKVDILFVVDDSTSMSAHQQELSRVVPDLVDKLNSLQMDFQVAVTSTTTSTNYSYFPHSRQFLGSPKFLNNQNSNLLLNRLLVGEIGSDFERGLEAIEAVLSPSYLNAEAPGFLRADALLAVIIIGDEDDQSEKSTADYIQFLNRLKPNFQEGGQAWIVNFIGILADTYRCGNSSKTYTRALRYPQLVTASNGVMSSICDRDLRPALGNINARLIDILTAFKIDSEPNLDTLVVKINGVVIPADPVNGYAYIKQTDSLGRAGHYIKFYGTSIPRADAKISVTFTPKSSR